MTRSSDLPGGKQLFISFICSLLPGLNVNSANRVPVKWHWTIGLIFLLTCMFVLTNFGSYYLRFLAVVAFTGCGMLFHLAGIRRSFHVLLLSIPLSLALPLAGEHQLMFPSELLVAAFGLSVVINWIKYPSNFMDWMHQPLTQVIICYLFFLMASVCFSEMPVVSIKSVIIKILYIISFYGGGFLYFRKGKIDGKFILYYLFPLLVVVSVVLFRHAEFNFSREVSGYVTKPFYRDHTIYSAVLAFIIPLIVALAVVSKGMKKLAYGLCSLLLVVALFYAASRAAWLSLLIAFITGALIYFRFPRIGFLVIILLSTAFLFFKSDDIAWRLKSNRFDSGARNAGIEEQTKSVVNITNDQSNAERINRWKSAWRMFQEKPFSGFGPGTYQFVYFPFQREKDMTRISVKSPYNIAEGRGGTAHNEFLLVLAESGIFAALFFVLVALLTIATGIKFCYQPGADAMKLAMLMSFITFVVHSLFNNFMDTDKTAILFFMAVAFFAALQASFLIGSNHES